MKTKKNRFLMLTLMVLIAVGIFIKTEETLACACRTYGFFLGFCDVGLFMDTCSETGHACYSDTSITNRTSCIIDGPNNVNFAGCAWANSWSYCSETLCNTYVAGAIVEDATTNGATCRVTTLGKATCTHFVEGKWDNSEKKCVECDVNHVETAVAGNNISTYVDSAGPGGPYFVNALGVGKADGQFESACGADAVCDEDSLGDACGGGKTCDASGICVMAAGLTLTASASPTAIGVGASSTITFKVTLAGVGEIGALVDSIKITAGGGSITGNLVGCTSDYCCTTNAAGECTVTYDNVPAAATVATITSTKATKALETDSGPASAVVTVASADWICDPLGDPDYSDICGVLSILDTCESLDGAGPGCVGAWEDCGDSGCNAGCNGVCGTCVSPYQACDCVCGSGGCVPGALVCGAWSACAAGSQSRSCNDGCNNSIQIQNCCANDAECVGAPGGAICDTSVPNGRCVNCMTNDDCAGTEVCDIANNVCIPCKTEGEVPPVDDALLCCEGLGYWDTDGDGVKECTSKCDPNASFFCNTLRSTVDTIVQGGEKMIGYILGVIGSVALLLIIIAGIMYMTAAGSEEKIASSKRILTGSIIGLGIALLAFSLLQVILSVLNM